MRIAVFSLKEIKHLAPEITRRRDITPYIVLGLVILILALFIIYPLGKIIILSFIEEGDKITFKNLTLHNFSRFITPGLYRKTLINSLVVSLGTVIFSLSIGIPMAYIITRIEIPFKTSFLSLGTLPLIMPPFVGAYAWILLLGKRGIITTLIRDNLGFSLPSIYGPFGIILAMGLSYYPFVFLLAHGVLSSADPSLEESAEIMGASQLRRILTVTLPLILPTLGAGAVIVFMRAIGNFGVPAILGGEYYVLPTLVYFQIVGYYNINAAGAIALVSTFFSILSILLLRYFTYQRGFTTITSRTKSVRLIRSKGAKILGFSYCVIILIFSLAPHIIVVVASFTKRWISTVLPSSYTLENYQKVFTISMSAILNSFFLATVATLASIVIGTLSAYVAVRKKFRGKELIDLTVMLPFILPGIMVGVAILSGFSAKPLVLSGTWIILAVAYFIRRMPYSFRATSASLAQIDIALEEASITTGANWWTTFRRVILPLMAPGIIASGIITFATLIGELTTTIILYSAQWKTITVAIYEYLISDMLGPACALGTILILSVLGTVILANKILGKGISSLFG